ncbi:MAG: DsrE/DsrF/DrsH-like family protein [Candidatus Gastranaerophilaceae bacterium]|jgi:NADPH-dependent 2,4-dienoyl-CoA reductase/sulfur reductase-like enzyme/peroxiredoxin family protein/TusA-related sulfurtransferase/rhodanese-related sulfurtransferase
MKILIVGGVAGGASTAARLRRLDEKAEIIIFERGKHISFANCGIPYYCGDVIKDREKLLIMTPQKLKNLLNVEARVESEVTRINRDNKTITVFNKATNMEYEESYDKLVLSPGASPIKPPIEGIDDSRIFTIRNLDDADSIKKYISDNSYKNAAIIGGGFIGIEMAENFAHLGLGVSIVEMSNQVMNQLDYEIAAQVHNHLRSKGINLFLGDGVKSFGKGESLKINLHSGKQIDVDFAILSIGVKPETSIAQKAGLEIGKTGGILVNKNLQTLDENIYALGDAVEVRDFISESEALIPLAGPANKQGRIVAENICGINTTYKATQGTAIVKVFDLTVASTGNSEKQLIRNSIPYIKSYTQGFSHAEYYPEAFPLMIKLLFSPENGKILGSQIIGLEGVDKRIDVIASSLRLDGTVRDLVELELAYAPPFGSAKDPVNIAGMVAENILTAKIKPVYWDEIDKLSFDFSEVFILDVRTREEQALGRFNSSVNIPLEELRTRFDEIPKDKKIIIYCTKGLKSYFAARILTQNDFNNVYNLNGGYSLYKQVIQNKQDVLVMNKKSNQANIITSNIIEIDACGMQCPGPIMKLSENIGKIKPGEVLNIKTTDPGFKNDIQAWCNSSGNTLIDVKEENKVIRAQIQKGMVKSESPLNQKNDKTLVVFSNDLDKALASFIIANGAATSGKQVTMFFTFWGLNILRRPESVKVKKGLLDMLFGMMMPKGASKLALSKLHMGGMGTLMMKYVMKSKNVDTLQELIQQAKYQGIKLIACQMSLDVMGIKPEELIDGVEIAGVASYINSAENSDLNLFI